MKIHSLFILSKTGACLYSRNFSEDFKNIEPNLITPFFSAIFSFSENVISQKTPEILEMGTFRFVFQIKEKFIYTLLADSSVSLLFVKSRLKTIANVFEIFLEENEIEEHEIVQNDKFDERIDGIITGEEEIINSKVLYGKIIDLIKELVYENEILGAALFAINGKVIYTSLPQDILLSSIKELEIRFMVANEFEETFYSLENDQRVFSKRINIPWKLEPLIIVVLFDSGIPTGMAEVNLDKIVKNVENII